MNRIAFPQLCANFAEPSLGINQRGNNQKRRQAARNARRCPMRICFYTDSFLPYCSGVTYAVANQASELARRGHQVCICRAAPGRSPPPELMGLPASVEVLDLPVSIKVPRIPGLYVAAPTGTTLLRVARFKPDVIHLATEWGCGWEGLFAAKLLHVATVGTFHTFFADPGYLRAAGLPDLCLLREMIWRYQVFFFRRCNVVTCPSAAVQQALVAHGLRPIPRVVSNGVPLPEPHAATDVAELRRQCGLDASSPTFLYVGRISKEKSLEIALRAFQRVVERRPGWRFVLVGDGPFRPQLDQLIRELGVDQHVLWLGMIPHDELMSRSLFSVGDAFVTASKTENQPLSILEAMAFGLPVIGTEAKGIPELVAHESNGLLFSPDDVKSLAGCMERLGGDVELRRRMGQAARRVAQSHSVAGAVDALEAAYQSAISQHAGRVHPCPADIPTLVARPLPPPSARWSDAGPDHRTSTAEAAVRRAS